MVYDEKINAKLDELEKLKSIVMKITPTLSDSVGGSRRTDKFEDTMAKIIDLDNELNESIDKLIDRKKQIIDLLDLVEDKDQYRVLHDHYMSGKSFEKIACDMNMTYRNVCYIHGKALLAFAEIMKSFH